MLGWRYYDKESENPVSPELQALMDAYGSYLERAGFAKAACDNYTHAVKAFLETLGKAGSVEDITETAMCSYVTGLQSELENLMPPEEATAQYWQEERTLIQRLSSALVALRSFGGWMQASGQTQNNPGLDLRPVASKEEKIDPDRKARHETRMKALYELTALRMRDEPCPLSTPELPRQPVRRSHLLREDLRRPPRS